MAATSHRTATAAVLGQIKALVTALTWTKLGHAAAAAFGRVELFDCEQLTEAFRYLLVTEQRVCVLVPLDERFETVTSQQKLLVKRVLPVAVLMSDRILGSRQHALYGDANTPGAMGLMELALPALTGLLLPNPNGVVGEPRNVSVMAVRDTEKELPSRVAVCLELDCRGGYLEAPLLGGPVY